MKFPRSRSECINGLRPCPWVRCKYHLYLDVIPRKSGPGRICYNFLNSDEEPGSVSDMSETCVLDLVENGRSLSLEEIGTILRLTRERIRQIENTALKKCVDNLSDYSDTPAKSKYFRKPEGQCCICGVSIDSRAFLCRKCLSKRVKRRVIRPILNVLKDGNEYSIKELLTLIPSLTYQKAYHRITELVETGIVTKKKIQGPYYQINYYRLS